MEGNIFSSVGTATNETNAIERKDAMEGNILASVGNETDMINMLCTKVEDWSSDLEEMQSKVVNLGNTVGDLHSSTKNGFQVLNKRLVGLMKNLRTARKWDRSSESGTFCPSHQIAAISHTHRRCMNC